MWELLERVGKLPNVREPMLRKDLSYEMLCQRGDVLPIARTFISLKGGGDVQTPLALSYRKSTGAPGQFVASESQLGVNLLVRPS